MAFCTFCTKAQAPRSTYAQVPGVACGSSNAEQPSVVVPSPASPSSAGSVATTTSATVGVDVNCGPNAAAAAPAHGPAIETGAVISARIGARMCVEH